MVVSEEVIEITSSQTFALFNYLNHEETYREFTALKYRDTISLYGHPFNKPCEGSIDSKVKFSPIMKLLYHNFIFTETLPAVRDADVTYWSEHVQVLLERIADQNLSESYDRGRLGKRKVIGMALSVFFETISRGVLLKYEGDETHHLELPSKPKQLVQNWIDFKRELVFNEGFFDDIISAYKVSEDPLNLPPLAQGAREYVRIQFASILHYLLVMSPDASSILTLLEKVVGLIPWFAMRQAFRVSNAATIVTALSKIFLTKPLFASKNLLQTIFMTILGNDQKSLEKKLYNLESGKNGPLGSTIQLNKIKLYVDFEQDKQEAIRNYSLKKNCSIVDAILHDAGIKVSSSQQEQINQMDFLSLLLSRRDRIRLIKLFCEDSLFTNWVRETVNIFSPIIREGHRAVDLSSKIGYLKEFMDDCIQMGNGKGEVLDWVKLVEKHECKFHKFANSVCQSEWLVSGYTPWFKHCLASFKPSSKLSLEGMKLSKEISEEIETFRDHQDKVKNDSMKRLSAVVAGQHVEKGPGEWVDVLYNLHLRALVSPQITGQQRTGQGRRSDYGLTGSNPNMAKTLAACEDDFIARLMEL